MKQDGSTFFSIDTPPLGVGQKVKVPLFKNMVMLHTRLKCMTNAVTYKLIFCYYTDPQPLGWYQMS